MVEINKLTPNWPYGQKGWRIPFLENFSEYITYHFNWKCISLDRHWRWNKLFVCKLKNGWPCDLITQQLLTHWGRVTHMYVSIIAIIDSDNGLSPARYQAMIWIIAGILLNGPPGTIFSEIVIEFHTFPYKKVHFKMSSINWLPFTIVLNVLMSLMNIDKCLKKYACYMEDRQ